MSNEQKASDGHILRRARVVTVVGFLIGGVLPGMLGLAALVSAEKNPSRASMLTSIAWLIMIVGWALVVLYVSLAALGVVEIEG